MRVKRLEIQGFKSFKDKTTIHFDHGITGIVGPNGCGKSNIVDAFFWVMGEQSYKHMRGQSSEDLIFNGSAKYPQLGMAEATLTLEIFDPDKKEVSVTRRLYRSGEGEYFINGILARLKDIQELFMDTGVGAKGYSVIEQGQIGKIVNAKHEERRSLIEEAAGISKYKSRKKESLRKLEATQLNLTRLTDIMQEMEKHLGGLERQAQKAKLYQNYKQELFGKEIIFGQHKLKEFQKKSEELKTQKNFLEQGHAILEAELQENENTLELERIQSLSESKVIDELQNQIQEISNTISERKTELELSKHKEIELQNKIQSFEVEYKEIESALNPEHFRSQEIEKNFQETEKLHQTAAQLVTEKTSELEIKSKQIYSLRSELANHQLEWKNKTTEHNILSNQLTQVSGQLETAQIRIEELKNQTQEQEKKTNTLREELGKLRNTLSEYQKAQENLKHKKTEFTEKAHLQTKHLKESENQLQATHRFLIEIQSKLKTFIELDHAHEGLGDAAKKVIEWAHSHGRAQELFVLTDVLTVTKGYEAVAETWLEYKMEGLLVKNTELAFLLLKEVKANNLGRIHLQLLDSLVLSEATVKLDAMIDEKQLTLLLKKFGFEVIGQLTDFVKSNEFTTHLTSYLERVCIVDSSIHMAELLTNPSFHQLAGWAIVSLDGVVLEWPGVLRSGKEDAGTVSILKRKQSIQELEQSVLEMKKNFSDQENHTLNLRKILETTQLELQTIQVELQSIEIQSTGIERDIHQLQKIDHELKTQLETQSKQIQDLEAQTRKWLENRTQLENKLKILLENQAYLESESHLLNQQAAEEEKILKNLEQEVQSLKLNEVSSHEKTSSLKRELLGLRALILKREERATEIKYSLEKMRNEKMEFFSHNPRLEQEIENFLTTLSELKQTLTIKKNENEKLNTSSYEKSEKIKSIRKETESKKNEFNKVILELERTSAEVSHLILNLEEKYGSRCLEVPLPLPVQKELIDESLLLEDVERLREKIRKLGEVNTAAIEEYEQLKQRHEHLIHEKRDLESSLENLQEAIQHINKTSEERFQKAFNAISDRFEKLFPIIFGGGQAKLSLVYPEGCSDPLEAGVDILAQPPGKKIANISLLSGGEKALTAVSLIFAIFMVKPSPFCVLDEVDAPLDDANIGKFNVLLKEMSLKSQFILITHNKKTMELNDILYGVTMEEPGVSKMVSIQMH